MAASPVEQGARALAAGDLSKAIELFEAGTRANAKDADAWLGLARAHLTAEAYPKARAALDQVLAIRPGLAEAASHKALLDFQDGKAAALAQLEALAAKPDAGFYAFYNLGAAKTAKGDLAGATTAYQSALGKEPRSPYVHVELGRLALAGKDPRRAIEHFQKAAELAPAEWVPLLLQARAHVAVGEVGRAIEALDRAIRIAPKQAVLYGDMVKLQLAAGAVPGALAAAKALYRLDANDPGSLQLMGVTSLAAGQVAEAAKYLEEAQTRAPQSKEIADALAQVRKILR